MKKDFSKLCYKTADGTYRSGIDIERDCIVDTCKITIINRYTGEEVMHIEKKVCETLET